MDTLQFNRVCDFAIRMASLGMRKWNKDFQRWNTNTVKKFLRELQDNPDYIREIESWDNNHSIGSQPICDYLDDFLRVEWEREIYPDKSKQQKLLECFLSYAFYNELDDKADEFGSDDILEYLDNHLDEKEYWKEDLEDFKIDFPSSDDISFDNRHRSCYEKWKSRLSEPLFSWWMDNYGYAVQVSIRAALDTTCKPSAGVLGFTVKDIRAMYGVPIPDWVAIYGDTNLNDLDDNVGIWL